VTGTDH